jgi:16S rRNA U516 pseudouridylate synthase RsuA-like enzyme
LPALLTVSEASPRVATLELKEGRFHQVKRMMASQGCTVTSLHR